MATNKPNPYVPSFIRAAVSGSRPITLTWGDVADTNIASTSSFIYDPMAALKSTQQLNVDWSRFENHTFFMSAEAKVNLAFDTIINGYPFDGTRQETERFFENLTGFDRWVFDSFPRYRGALAFSGSTGGGAVSPETGTFVEVKNRTGALFPELSADSAGSPVLNPTGSQSMTIEAQLLLPTIANDDQVVCQMSSGPTQGFGVNLLASLSTSSCVAEFFVVSGSSWMNVTAQLTKGTYNHVAFVLNRTDGVPRLENVTDSGVVRSTTQVELGDLDIDRSSFTIGSGTAVSLGAATWSPTSTLSGTLDELRVFHSARTSRQLAAYARKSVFATDDLVLYYRFNEPPPPLTTSESDATNAIVLDSSGHSLHALVSNFTGSLRVDAGDGGPMAYEHADTTTVLFPAYPPTIELNAELLTSASMYDKENPNLITRLVPQHYLLEGAAQDGFDDPPEGNAGQAYSGTGIPGQGKMGNVQIMVSLLYVWARFFDELKLFVDSFSTLHTVDYETNDTVPDSFLLDMVRGFGFHLPPLFSDASLEQYVRGENVDAHDISTNEVSLRACASALLRRVLINIPDVIRSKGTQHSIRSFLRAVGIDPNNNVRIREFGGPTSQQLTFARESRFEAGTMTKFGPGCLATTPYLTASRVEPGFPLIVGSFVQQSTHPPNGISDSTNDGLLTSGSWTWEGIVKYAPQDLLEMSSPNQSFVRLCVTGSTRGTTNGSAGVVANLVAVSSSTDPRLLLFARPGDQPSSPLLTMEVATQPAGYTDRTDRPRGIFNNDVWNVSFGCQRGDDGLGSAVSSSYFLRLAYQNVGEVEVFEATSSYFLENPTGANVLQSAGTSANALGTFIAIGTNQLVFSGIGDQYLHLNDYSQAPDEARTTAFDGRMSDTRFWSRALSLEEWREHVRNHASVGVRDPLVNWNYVKTRSGSFGRLRMNVLTPQSVRHANSTASVGPMGTITFVDFSENGMHLTGSGFPTDRDCVVGEVFEVSHLSPYFDEASSDQKVRARSYQDQALVDATPWAQVAPVHEIVRSETPTDDVRFVIEFSLVDALNRDIVAIFATFDALDNALGAPELLFSPDYPDIEDMRDAYFNRVKDKLNFQAFFEFFRWFDSSIGTFIQQLVPRKTRFKGTNFTIESHMLERAKQEYFSNEMYLGESMRQNLNAVILLQQVAGAVKRY